MALEKHGSGRIYLSIADGKLVRQYKDANPNTTERVNKNGKLVYEEKFDSITGLLTGISKKDNDYGTFLEIGMQDGSDTYNISMQFSSRYSSSFMKMLPNIKTTEPVKLLPWSLVDSKDASKKITGITLYQDDGNGFVKILPYYTKEDPKGLPQMVKAKIKGKEVWDDFEMMQFLFEGAKKIFSALPTKPYPEQLGTTQETSEDEHPF